MTTTNKKNVTVGEAAEILKVSRATVNRLIAMGRLSGRMQEKLGRRRQWLINLSEVARLQKRGDAVRHWHRRGRVIVEKDLWLRHFGPVPDGYTVVTRTGKRTDIEPGDLCLIPHRRKWKSTPRTARDAKHEWTEDDTLFLRESFPCATAREIGEQIGCSRSTVVRIAKEMKLRKPPGFIGERVRQLLSQPIGTEKVRMPHNTVWVKVTTEGKYQDQWRPKHHLVWEEANKQRLPKELCVVFRDGNKRNFDPKNLEVATHREVAAMGFAQFQAYPEPLRRTIRAAKKIERELEKAEQVGVKEHATRRSRQARGRNVVWTRRMETELRRRYPTGDLHELLSDLGVSRAAMRRRVVKLGVRRSPLTMIQQARSIAAIEKENLLKETNRAHT